MRLLAGAALTVVLVSCGGSASTASTSSAASSSPAAGAQTLAGAYGLLMEGDRLELITPSGAVAASVAVAPSTLGPQACSQGAAAWTLPPISSSSRHVYFRDGDTKIRMLVPPASSQDVTTVPGGANVVSGFSVSPDDQRIAVSVETFSASGITDRLYVEDLRGGGNHAEIYSTSVPAGKQSAMLWPMGWHEGHLVLAVWVACTFEFVPYPSAWHVADAATAVRLASIGDQGCVPDPWPSPAGEACYDFNTGRARVYDWNGQLRATLATDAATTELSPAGDLLAAGNGGDLGGTSPSTTMRRVDGSGVVTTTGRRGCLWIDEDHLLAPDAVIAYPSGAVTAFAAHASRCAGRFPGSL